MEACTMIQSVPYKVAHISVALQRGYVLHVLQTVEQGQFLLLQTWQCVIPQKTFFVIALNEQSLGIPHHFFIYLTRS